MTFDDGIVKIYDVENAAKPGETPRGRLKFAAELCYALGTVGITRYYEALKAGQKIDAVIVTYLDKTVKANQIAVSEEGEQYLIRMVQPGADENGIKIMKLSLEQSGENYEIAE